MAPSHPLSFIKQNTNHNPILQGHGCPLLPFSALNSHPILTSRAGVASKVSISLTQEDMQQGQNSFTVVFNLCHQMNYSALHFLLWIIWTICIPFLPLDACPGLGHYLLDQYAACTPEEGDNIVKYWQCYFLLHASFPIPLEICIASKIITYLLTHHKTYTVTIWGSHF